ncbi:GTP pyrophosphokinase [Paraburkholderia tropica]|uniref:GTP pyrophosphokinase n=1 Tax=Paraburkholderia tropica TaxID=92647 RepID=UPI002AB25E09|nr:RelA/SpoT domain-containing protein [Paraburkholderia tropica]
MSDINSQLTDAYHKQIDTYSAFTESLHSVIRNILKAKLIEPLAIEARTKSFESFDEKIAREDKQGKYKTLSDITDLSGLRVIAYLQDECKEITSVIRDNFDVDDKNSADRGADVDPDRFGYLSTHLIISYTENRIKLPEFSIFSGLKAEIQIRTLLQHSWAAINWRTDYKSEVEAPKGLRRRLHRISAFLEAVDDDFSFVIKETALLREQYKKDIREGNLNISLNKTSLLEFLSSGEGAGEVARKVGAFGGGKIVLKDISDASTSGSLKFFQTANVSSLLDLKSKIIDHLDDKLIVTKKCFDDWIESENHSSISTNSADITRILYLLSLGPSEAKSLLPSLGLNQKFLPFIEKHLGETNPPASAPQQ